MRGPRSTNPCPTKEQVEKLKLLQTAIKKRTVKPDFITTYKIHIIISIVIGFQSSLFYHLPSKLHFGSKCLFLSKTLFKNDFTQQINVEKCKLSVFDEIPINYNFKEAYPQCNHQVYNQGNCSSSYAIAVSSSFSDRVCKQNQTQQLSAQNLLSCDGKLNLGCKGGHLTRSADYIIKHGLTTNQCHPFRGDDIFKECTNTLEHCQRYKANSYCQLQNKEDIKRDLFINGAVVAIMPVYKDFVIYRDGIYQVLEGQPHFHGGQAIKIIGWGELNAQQYQKILGEIHGELMDWLKQLLIVSLKCLNEQNTFQFFVFKEFKKFFSFTQSLVQFCNSRETCESQWYSGVKINSIQKNGNRIIIEIVETVNKVKEQQKLQEYIQELENNQIPQRNKEQEQLEKRILKLLQKNHDFELEMELIRLENEQLKQLLIEQQTKIIEQNQKIMTLKILKDGFKKYSFSDYFKQQNQ